MKKELARAWRVRAAEVVLRKQWPRYIHSHARIPMTDDASFPRGSLPSTHHRGRRRSRTSYHLHCHKAPVSRHR
eukprot:4041250-Pyramimonas_sp.AAC.1